MDKNTEYENFLPDRLAKLRVLKGVSAREMSLSIGQNANYINRIENKKTLPSMQGFFYICEFLDITPQEFFDEENSCPTSIRNLIKNIKTLDEKSLNHISGLVDKLVQNK